MWRISGQRLLVRGRNCRLAGQALNHGSFGGASSMFLEQPTAVDLQQRCRSRISQNSHETRRRHNFNKDYDARRAGKAVDPLLKQANGLLHRLSSKKSVTLSERDLAQAVNLIDDILSSLSRDAHESQLSTVDRLFCAVLEKANNSSKTPIPSSNSFCAMIVSWSKNDSAYAADRASYWLQEMIESGKRFPEHITPPRASLYSTVLSAWERQAAVDAGTATRRGQELWQQLQEHCANKKHANIPSSAYYMYISLWSKSGLSEAPVRAEEVLKEMVKAGVSTCAAFVNVISAWRKSSSPDAPHRALAILDLLVDEYQRRRSSNGDLKINDAPFNATIHACTVAPSNSTMSHLQAEESVAVILSTMKELDLEPSLVTVWSILPLYESLPNGEPNPIRDSSEKIFRLLGCIGKKIDKDYNMLLNQVYSKAIKLCSEGSNPSNEGLRAAEIADQIFLQRYMKLPRVRRRLEPNMEAFISVIEAWKRQLQNPHARDAEEKLKFVLKKMEEEANRINDHKGNPSVYAYLSQAWAKSSLADDALEQCEKNIDRLLQSYKRQSNHLPRLAWFHEISTAVSDNYASERANAFLCRLHQKLAKDPQFYKMIASSSTDGSTIDARDQDLLDGVLDALVLEPGSYSGKRAEIILLKIQELHERAKDIAPPTFSTFKKVLDCWSNSVEEGAPQRAEDILALSEQLYNAGDMDMKPSLEAYISVILAWSRSYSPEAPERIKKHIVEMKRRRSDGDSSFVLDDQLYAALIRAYAHSGRDDALAMAQAVFDATPRKVRSTLVYNALIEAHGGDSMAAEEVLQSMHHAFSMEGNALAKPDAHSFNAVLQSWILSGSPMTAWRADSIFKRMQDLDKHDHFDVKPNTRTFDLVISALAQDVDVQLKIESYLSLLKQHYESGEYDCTLTATSYTEAIRAWCSKTDDPRAFLRAQALLDEMHELARDGEESLRPDRTTYGVYLKALSQSSVEARAELANDAVMKMRDSNVKIDQELHRILQRCFLPVHGHLSSWVLKMDGDL